MSAPHILRVETGAGDFADLLAAVSEAGLRAGWLEWTEPLDPPAALAEAGDAGAWRAVRVGAAGSVAVKRRRGGAVFADVVREHFQGCALVLARGAVDAPALAAAGSSAEEDWLIESPRRGTLRLTTVQVVAALRKPTPF